MAAPALVLQVVEDAGATLGADVCASLGGLVRRERQKRQWSQRELALRAGFDRGAVARLERGQPASLALVAIIAQALNLHVQIIVEIHRRGS